MQRKKILWLVSWYPNKNDRFDGDFIQRHARAAAIYNDVHVIFVADAEIKKAIEEEWNYSSGLTEQIVYFKKKTGILGRLRKQMIWKGLYQRSVKQYISKNGLPDFVHVHVPWKTGLIALWMKRKYGLDFIVSEHWGIYNTVVEGNIYTMLQLAQALIKRIFIKAKKVVSVSKFLSNGIGKITGRNADEIIFNVVDTTLFFYKEEKYSRFTFLHVSNMVALKNVRGILDSFNQMIKTTKAEVQLILIGNRDDEYVKYADELRLLNVSVFFKGEISYGEVAEEMQRSHCFILNSLMENSPCVIGEALCCGLPIVATNVGGIPELVEESNSKLIQPNDTKALADAMEYIWKNYSIFNQKRIAQKASERFSYFTIAERLNKLYQTVSNNKT